jgi:hypothetical protein
MTSLSTRFFGQPRLTNPTFGRADIGLSGTTTEEDFEDMQSFDFTIRKGVGAEQERSIAGLDAQAIAEPRVEQ